MKKIVNGVEVEMTQEEIDDFLALQNSFNTDPVIMQKNYTLALEVVINDKAQEKSYSNAVSCASYKDSTNAQWAAEATAFIAWRDICYQYAYDYLAQVQDGTIPNPSIEDFISGVPEMEWPTTEEGQ